MLSVNAFGLEEWWPVGQLASSSSEGCVTKSLWPLVYLQNAHCLHSSELRLAFIPDHSSTSYPTLLLKARANGGQAAAAQSGAALQGRPTSLAVAAVRPGISQSPAARSTVQGPRGEGLVSAGHPSESQRPPFLPVSVSY